MECCACVCVKEMVDENQDKKWECPECSSMRAERRSLAAQRARLKRSSQGKAIGRLVSLVSTWEAREGGGGGLGAGQVSVLGQRMLQGKWCKRTRRVLV